MLSVEERKAELWRRGILRWKLYPQDQAGIYDWTHERLKASERVIVENISRQFGKSFIAGTIADEYARQHPGALIRFVTGSQKSLRKIVHPILRELHRDCPAELRPVWNSMDGLYRYPGGAELHLAGANDGHADDSRGQRAHLCVVDEAGFVDDLDYLVTSVLLPQTLTTGGKVILISTPPVTPAHDFVEYAYKAEARGTYIKRTIDDNRHLTERAKESLIEEMGGREATKARRELWCEFVVEEERAIVPEYTEAMDKALAGEPTPPPTYERPLVAMDVGWSDAHAILAGYYHFASARLVVEDECLLHRATTDRIAAAVKDMEARLWQGKRPPSRYSDTDLRLIGDLSELHGLHFAPTAKDEKEAQVNALRMLVKARRLWIHPRCVNLRRQLRVGIWNERRTEFERTKQDGHFDAVDALIYMLRNAPVYENPYPALPPGITSLTHHIPRNLAQPKRSEAGSAVASLFKGRR